MEQFKIKKKREESKRTILTKGVFLPMIPPEDWRDTVKAAIDRVTAQNSRDHRPLYFISNKLVYAIETTINNSTQNEFIYHSHCTGVICALYKDPASPFISRKPDDFKLKINEHYHVRITNSGRHGCPTVADMWIWKK